MAGEGGTLDMSEFLESALSSQQITSELDSRGSTLMTAKRLKLDGTCVDFSLESTEQGEAGFVFDPNPDVNGNQHLTNSMESNGGMSMDTSSPMSSMSSMSSADVDIKPNISQLNVSTSNSYPGMHMSSAASMGYGNMQNSHPQGPPPPYYGMPPGMGGSNVSPPGAGGGMPLQSPTLSSMSPAAANANMSSPATGSSLTPLQSPSSSMGSPPPGLVGGMGLGGPQSMTKHICAICGDRASGKHYGVYSCEGCKGFFKRTVRKDLTYACRDDKKCQIDKRQRNRCQYCRYMKCLSMGMKREAVQEERQRGKDGKDEVESTSTVNSEMPVEKILEAEVAVEPKTEQYMDSSVQQDTVQNICQAADKQLFTLVEWAKRIPHFTELPLEDQVILLRAGWNELLIAGFSHRSVSIRDGILLSTGLHVHRSTAHHAGVGTIFDRVLTELVAKMREMKMDLTELGCLRAIVLFNPDAKNLQAVQEVEAQREKVYASLEEYCKSQYSDEPGRFAKLLLRLPALRSIGLKCMEHLFFFKLIGDTPIDTFLMEMLENPNPC